MTNRASAVLAYLVSALMVGACDEPFSPTAEGGVQFSVFGFLDAAADTQWVRVMPIRNLALTSPDSFGITVTLEHMGTGRSTELRDSLFVFSHYRDSDLGSDGAHLHNFWTTEPIQPGATYRVVLTSPGKKPAEAMVEVPGEYQAEVWIAQNWDNQEFLRLEGLRHAPFVMTNAHFYDRCGPGIDNVRFRERSWDGETQVIPIEKPGVPRRDGCDAMRIESRDLWVVGSEAEWPSGMEHSTWALAAPEQTSNVTNAVGFIGGVLTKTLPYENCSFQDRGSSMPDHCRLRYGPESVTLAGRVSEARCGDGPVDTVTVELRELGGETGAPRKIRSTFTNRAGEFMVGALEPGVSYLLKARAKPEPDPFWGEVDIYTIHTDTVVFTPGEVAAYDVELRRLTQCGGGS